MQSWIRFGLVVMLLGVSACGSNSKPLPESQQGVVKVGSPYVVEGRRYYPGYTPDYDEIGEASWYGPGFHGKHTANGETMDSGDLTAAHTTLPMPSLVRVTNLSNGKSIIVRINDRGPFAHDRIIDLSEKAADELGVKSTGVAKVRVQYLRKETEDMVAMLKGERQLNKLVRTGELPPAKDQAEPPPVSEVASQDSNDFRSTTQVGGSKSDFIEDKSTRAVGDAAPMALVAANDLPPLGPPQYHPSDPDPYMPLPPTLPAGNTEEEQPSSAAPEPAPSEVTVETPKKSMPWQKPAALEPIPSAQPEPQPFNPPPRAQVEPKPFTPPTTSKLDSMSPSSGGNIFIQAGSFGSRENADKLARQLSDVGTPEVKEIMVGERMWYRVRLGPVSDRSTAQEMLGKVTSRGVKDARIITN